MTLQESIDHLNKLAAERGASITTTLQLEFAGVRLSVFWEDENLPREAHLHFGPGMAWDDSTKGRPDSFEWAWVIDPARFMAATEEGLSDMEVEEEARRIVVGMEQVDNYFLGRPYASRRKSLDSIA